jgi:hypothetical protein
MSCWATVSFPPWRVFCRGDDQRAQLRAKRFGLRPPLPTRPHRRTTRREAPGVFPILDVQPGFCGFCPACMSPDAAQAVLARTSSRPVAGLQVSPTAHLRSSVVAGELLQLWRAGLRAPPHGALARWRWCAWHPGARVSGSRNRGCGRPPVQERRHPGLRSGQKPEAVPRGLQVNVGHSGRPAPGPADRRRPGNQGWQPGQDVVAHAINSITQREVKPR